MKSFKSYINESIKPNSVLIKMDRSRLDPDVQRQTLQFDPRQIKKALIKILSDDAKKAMKTSYIDDADFVNSKTDSTMGTIRKDNTLADLAAQIEKWTKANAAAFAPKQPKPIVDIKSDTRAIITTSDEMGAEIKKKLHNAKTGIKIRVMKRKSGAMVY